MILHRIRVIDTPCLNSNGIKVPFIPIQKKLCVTIIVFCNIIVTACCPHTKKTAGKQKKIFLFKHSTLNIHAILFVLIKLSQSHISFIWEYVMAYTTWHRHNNVLGKHLHTHINPVQVIWITLFSRIKHIYAINSATTKV